MKIFLVAFLLTSSFAFANEPQFKGAYFGEVKNKMDSWSVYPNNSVSWAGNVYLYKNKIDENTYISDSKDKHITSAISEAKKYAIENKYGKYALGNIRHQVIISENKVMILTDYNVFAFE